MRLQKLIRVAMDIAIWPFFAGSALWRRAGTHRAHRWVRISGKEGQRFAA
jgi:hypothetical protein